MVNEDIVTALKNAVNKGESLESAINVMINSGYNPRDVQDASQFIARGVIPMMQPKNDELLTTPQKKGMTNSFPINQRNLPTNRYNLNQSIKPHLTQQNFQQNSLQNSSENIYSNNAFKIDNNKEIVKKKSYLTEIILLVILLILIGILIATVMFKDEILKALSG